MNAFVHSRANHLVMGGPLGFTTLNGVARQVEGKVEQNRCAVEEPDIDERGRLGEGTPNLVLHRPRDQAVEALHGSR